MGLRVTLAAAALALGTPLGATPDADVAARLSMAEAWLGTQLARENIPGASAAIVHGDTTLWAKGFGFANAAARVPATPDTRYSIWSISKLFTAMLATNADDADAGALSRELWDLVSPPLLRSAKPAPRTRNLAAFEGRHGRPASTSDVWIAQIGDELVSIPLFEARGVVKAATRWRPSGEDRFRRVLETGAAGDEIRFDRDKTGRITRLWVHSNPMQRMGT